MAPDSARSDRRFAESPFPLWHLVSQEKQAHFSPIIRPWAAEKYHSL